MIEITNKQKFEKVVSDAIEQIAYSVEKDWLAKRWENAINRAAEMIEAQGEFITFDEAENHLLVWSQDSNKIYTANGTCQCQAFEQGYPCKHRAAYKLVKNYKS